MANKPLAKLKSEMQFNADLTRLVDIMKGIAAAQYNMMERRRTQLKRYDEVLEALYGAYDFRRSHHPFIRASSERKLVLLVTTDGGFLGGLNIKVINAGMPYRNKGAHYLVIGERGSTYLRESGITHNNYPGINMDDSRYELAEKLTEDVMRLILKERYGQLIVIYPFPLSFTAQRVELLNFIPCPMFFKNKSKTVPVQAVLDRQVILESPPDGIIEMMTQSWLRKRFVEIFELSKLSEFGARTMHLESSYQTLSKIDKNLKLEFFKVRREKIDQSLRESFTSQLLCKVKE